MNASNYAGDSPFIHSYLAFSFWPISAADQVGKTERERQELNFIEYFNVLQFTLRPDSSVSLKFQIFTCNKIQQHGRKWKKKEFRIHYD